MPAKTDRFVFSPKEVEPIPFHDVKRLKEAARSAYNYLDDSLVPGADMVIHVTEYSELDKPPKPNVEAHKHKVSSFYGVIGDLTIEVTLEDERYEVSGPGSVFIPEGIMHSIRALKGTGYVIIALRQGKYE